jgi:serine/threonine protein kinase
LEAEDNFTVIENVEWGPPGNTDLDELAPKPKNGSMDDPCGCQSCNGELVCNNLSCVMFACQEECRSNCSAGEFCANKRIQRKEFKKIHVIDAGKKGRGLEALEDVKKGDIITEYCGCAVNKKFLPRLFQRYGNERKLYIMALDKDVYLDARSKGSLARYINHSCEPNCVVERWKVRGIIRAAVVARKDISEGTELSFDYQWERKRGRAPTKCHCGSPTCRGTLEVARSMEELALERKLNDHWKKPFMMRPQNEIVNRCIKVFSNSSQEYFTGDVTAYNKETGQHLIMYRHDLEEVWEDLKREDWMLLDEEAEQFIIRKKDYSEEKSGSLLNGNMLLQGQSQASKNFMLVPTHIKDALQSKHLIERCQRSCRVTITPTPITASSSTQGISDIELAERIHILSKAKDGTIWKLTIVGYDISKAHSILEKNVAFIERKFFSSESNEMQPSSSSSNLLIRAPNRDASTVATLAVGGLATSSTPGELPHEVILPRCIVDAAKRRLPLLRDKCRSVELTFVPSESKSKQFAKLVIEGTLQSDIESAKEQIWQQLNTICKAQNAPKTPSGLYKDLCFLGGELSSKEFANLLEFQKTSSLPGTKHDAQQDLSKWSPFFSSFESSQRCTLWVQSDSDRGRINSSNQIVGTYSPERPRKIYFGCSPFVVSKLWQLVQQRAQEVGRGVKYLYLGSDRLYQPMMMKHGGKFFTFVTSVTGASVTVDNMTGDHLRIDGRLGESFQNPLVVDNVEEGERALLAEELIRLQIELYRDHCIRQQNWIFGQDWSLAAKQTSTRANTTTKTSNGGGNSPIPLSGTRSSGGGNSFEQKILTNACVEISDIISTLKMDASVAAHAAVIMYRFSVICSSIHHGLKIREVLLACIFIANKAQKLQKWKNLQYLLEAAYCSFYPGVSFDPKKEEVLVWEEKVLAAELEILRSLDYDVFWRGFDWILATTTDGSLIDPKMAREAVIFSCSKPILAAGAKLWLSYGPEHVFCAAAGFLGANLEPMLPALSLIPIKVMQVAEMIAKSYRELSGSNKRQQQFITEKSTIERQLPSIIQTCTACMMSFATQPQSGHSSQTEQRYRLIGARGKMRRVFPRVPFEVVKKWILPDLDGICAESNCNIFVEQNKEQEGSHNIILEGSWRAFSIASYLLDQSIQKNGGTFHLERPMDSPLDMDTSRSSIEAKGDPGLFLMRSIETVDAWKGTIQSEITNQSFWGRKTGGKCCVPGKIKEAQLRSAGLRWWLPPRYGPSPTGSICDMFLINLSKNNATSNVLDTLGELTCSFQGNSAAFSMLTSNASAENNKNGNDRFVAVSLQRWPSEKVGNYEEKLVQEKKRKQKNKQRGDIGFSPGALQEMQLLNRLHGLIKSPQGHPNFILPVGLALPEVSNHGVDNNDGTDSFDISNANGNMSSLASMKGRIDDDIEDIFSLNRTSLENEVAVMDGRKRKDVATGPHLVFHATPFILQRFIDRKKKHLSSVSPNIFATWFHDLLSALLHCHSSDIILRTIQLDQIVVDHSGVAKIGGLYRATVLSKEDKETSCIEAMLFKRKLNKRSSEHSSSQKDDEILSNLYAAPEMLLGSPKFSKETDVWTLGCLFAHLLLNKPLYLGKDRDSTLTAMFKMIGTPSSEDLPEAVKFPHYFKPKKKYPPGVAKALTSMLGTEEAKRHAGVIDLIDKMLQLDPRKRLTAVGALQHDYMQTYGEQSMSESFRQTYVRDWVSLKKKLMHSSKSEEDERQERKRGIKRKAMLMAASSSLAGTSHDQEGIVGDEDDLYDINDMLTPATKLPKP